MTCWRGCRPRSRAASRRTCSSSTIASSASSQPATCWSRWGAARGLIGPAAGRPLPEAVDAFRFGGELLCLPQNITSLVVYYNRDLFAAAGVQEPDAGWTWDEMVQAATAMTEKPSTSTAWPGAHLIRMAPFIWSNGGELFDDPDNPTRFALDSPAPSKRCRTSSTGNVHATDPRRSGRGGGGRRVALPEWQDGDAPPVTALDADVPDDHRFRLGHRPLPMHIQPAGILHSDAYCMTHASGAKDAAWRFVEFALGATGRESWPHPAEPCRR